MRSAPEWIGGCGGGSSCHELDAGDGHAPAAEHYERRRHPAARASAVQPVRLYERVARTTRSGRAGSSACAAEPHVHGPLVAKLSGLRRYVQYHVASEDVDASDAPIDGIAELWFESVEEQRRAYAAPEYQAVVDDEPHLFEMNSHSVHPVMTEDIVTVVDTGDS